MLDWLIVGGGPHGVHLAARLRAQLSVATERLCIVDPHPRLLQRWTVNTRRTGMRHLRSPAVHHLDIDPFSLRKHAGRRRRTRGLFAAPYDRPCLSLFNQHSEAVIARFRLAECHVAARAQGIEVRPDGVAVATSTGTLLARKLALAISACDVPLWPPWARELKRQAPGQDRVAHIFDETCPLPAPADCPRITVIGGGITAAQAAIRLASEGFRFVTLASRHALREHQFDSDPGWIGPRNMAALSRERDYAVRRSLIQRARHSGSLPPDVHRALRRHLNCGSVSWRKIQIESAALSDDGSLLLHGPDGAHATDFVLLATGYQRERPGGALIDDLIENEGLPCADCGYPIVDMGLRWHAHIHAIGALAELELGPTARNIVGARAAAERIVGAAPLVHGNS